MIRSMTGFGEADRNTPIGRLRVELRTVNHRYLNVNFRLPTPLARWEPELREWLRGWFSRGHINCTIRLEATAAGGEALHKYRLDEERVKNYLAVFEQLRERFGISGAPDLALLTRFGDVLVRQEEDAEEIPITSEDLQEVIAAAARQATEMREEEGKRLETDLEERLAAVHSNLDQIENWAPERLISERDRLREVVRELVGGVAPDEARLAQEIAYLAERLDINEELVRFRSHLELFRDLLDADPKEPVGKRLSFLVQEMHREANTIGSKANDARIAHRVIAIKDEIERLREQVENIE